MPQKQQIAWVSGLTALFIGSNAWLIATMDFYWLLALPAVLGIVYLAFFHLDKLIWLIVFATPLSAGLEELDFNLGVSLPSEPMLAGAMLIFIANQLYGSRYDHRILFHPISVVILLSLVWMLMTTMTSELPEVSAKYTIARLWFVTVMYFAVIELFRRDLRNVRTFVWLYTVPLIGIVIYATYRLIQMGMDKEMAHFSMQPFYKDHAVYGACIALFIPLVAGITFFRKYPSTYRFFAGIVLIVLMMGLVFSYSRAAWVSIAGVVGLYTVMRLKLDLKVLLFGILTTVLVLFTFYDKMMMELERNKTDSSDDLAEHVESISNVSTDASNLERLNRWNAAREMWKERPLTGWGPGTYSFVYAPFQHSEDLTIISTNQGNLGNAHSEYLGPMSEQGVPGLLLVVALVGIVVYRSLTLYYNMDEGEEKMILAGAFLGLVTYFIHGVLNNYLDSDKASVPFWALMAVVLAIDIDHWDRFVRKRG